MVRAIVPALALIGALLSTPPLQAQKISPQPDRTIDAPERAAVIDATIRRIEEAYVFPDVATRLAATVRARVARKEYDGITSAASLARTLTSHLQDASHDKHLSVVYDAAGIPEQHGEPPPDEHTRAVARMRWLNFGFERVERLPGNVGYLDLRGFSGLPEAGETGVAAMNFLANSDALIVDLRQNGGGSASMIGLISSYLFDDAVHLNDFYMRESNETRQFWTQPHVQGQRFGSRKPVYVLTSSRTFSAAEEFAYNLKVLKRATIVGEVTGGGAHPGDLRRVNAHFAVFVPAGRAINPVTKTDWEGTGVVPDIGTDAALALETAHVDALTTLVAHATDTRRKELLERALADARNRLDSHRPPPAGN